MNKCMWSGFAVLFLLSLSACATASLEAPKTFATFDQEESAYLVRSASPLGVVLGVRAVKNDPQASSDFWTSAIRTQLEKGRGYAFLEQRKVRAKSGQTGTELRFGRDLSGEPYSYWIGIYVTKRHVYLVEAGGRMARVDAVKKDLEKTLASLELGGGQ